MAKVEQILKNPTYDYPLISIHSIEDGVNKLTKLDEWIFEHLIDEKEYRYEYLASYLKPIVTWDLGSNYPLDEKLREKIIRKDRTGWRIR